jgi:hypothetical protein
MKKIVVFSLIKISPIIFYPLGQWFLTFWAPRTPKSQQKVPQSLKVLIGTTQEVQMVTKIYFCDLHGPPRPTIRTSG